ncbi:hypothetical protein [Nostoc sp.]|uniref:hypothetical protein n=1 Tax=Nostoc sp. TaxID=1180 RepID=UPI002FF9D80B
MAAAASRLAAESQYEVHFQPEAVNEVLKGFALKLTPMLPVGIAHFLADLIKSLLLKNIC